MWLHNTANLRRLGLVVGFSPVRVIIAGDSGGANLALALTIKV